MTERLIPVDAICTGCKKTVVKRERAESPANLPASFKDVCHRCQRVTWWNVVEVLQRLIEQEETERKAEA